MLHPPKFATQRDERFPTRGRLAAGFGTIWLGHPFMPWQQLVADVLGEYDPATGLPRHTLAVVTVQRQAGKSHLSMSLRGERCMSVPGYRSWYTAQTGGDARDQFLKFHDDVIVGQPLESVVRTLRGNGHEVMRWPNSSTIRPHPPTEGALHGKQVDADDIDEGWWFTKEHGEQLLQAASPAKLTRPGAQTVIWSAGGTAASTWLAEYVARGRAGDPSLAYFEFGIPDDLDLNDLQTVAEYHPAYKCDANPHGTITLASIETLRKDITDDDAFARAGGNRWTGVIGGVIDKAAWERVRYSSPIPDDVRVAYGAARAADGTHVVLAAAAVVDGVVVVEVVDVMPAHRAGQRIAGLCGYDKVAVPASGPGAPLVDELADTHAQLVPMTAREEASACARVRDSLPDRGIRFRQHPALDAAVGAAATRSVGDGGRVWARSNSSAPIAALEAATAASWSVRKLDDQRTSSGPIVVEFA